MYVFHQGNPVYSCKPCNKRIAAEDLHEIYYEQLKTFLMTETEVADYLSKTDSVIQEKEKLLSLLMNENSALRKRKTELINLRIAGELSKDTFAEQFSPIEERVAQIDTQLPAAQAEVDFLKINRESSDTVLKEAKDLYSQWPTLPFEEKRGIVEIITNSITVGNEDISIKLSYIPNPPSQNGGKRYQSLLALIPFSQHEIVVPKPLRKGYTEYPQTIGNYLRNRRLKLRLSRPKVALVFGVSTDTILRWENNTQKPGANYRDKITEFLGYKVDE